MKNPKILATFVVLPILGIFSYVHADYDCSTIDRESIQTLLEKQAAGDTLTTDESTTLANAQACRREDGTGSTMNERRMRFSSGETMPERTGSGMMRYHNNKFGSGETLTDTQKAQMEQIKTIREKQKNGETLTSDEQTLLNTFDGNMKNKGQEKKGVSQTTSQTLSETYQKAIDNKLDNLMGNYSSKEEKVNMLNTFSTKVNTLKSSLDSLNLTESKKATYISIINYLLDKINTTLNSLNSQNDTDTESLLNQILN